MSNEFKHGDEVIWEGEEYIFLSMSPLHPAEECFCVVAHYGGSLHWVRSSELKLAPRECEVWFVMRFGPGGPIQSCECFDNEIIANAVRREKQRYHDTESDNIVCVVRGPFMITVPEDV